MSRTSLSAGIIIREILLEDPAVTGITSRVFPVVSFDDKLPYVFYHRSGSGHNPVSGMSSTDRAEVEICCCAADYDEGLALAEAVRGALDGKCAASSTGMRMRACRLSGSEEFWENDAYVQLLRFEIMI